MAASVLGLTATAAAATVVSCYRRSSRADRSPAFGPGFGGQVEEQCRQPGGAARWISSLAAEHGLSPTDSVSLAKLLDARDSLADFRGRFHFPRVDAEQRQSGGDGGGPCLYFVGNSLGLQPKTIRAEIEHHLQEWEDRGVEGHFTGPQPWMPIEDSVTAMMAAVVGAKPTEVVCMNTLSVNLHVGMAAFYRPTPARHRILVERRCFPSDEYAVQSQALLHGYDPKEAILYFDRRKGEEAWRTEDLLALLEKEGQSVALVLLGGVQYLTGQLFDMGAITAAAHAQGCRVGWDLAHAVGNAPLQLHEWGADFACWCTYKYLNSGPGNIGGFFVHERHHATAHTELPRLAGWWGHRREDRFAMAPTFTPTPSADGFQLSNPSVLCMASLLASLRLFAEAGMGPLRQKSLALTGYLELLLQQCGLCPQRLVVLTPADPQWRGCQLSLRFDCQVDVVEEKLRKRGVRTVPLSHSLLCALSNTMRIWLLVMVDTRKPDVMRVAPAPLYNSFEDVRRFVQELAAVVGTTPPTAGWQSLSNTSGTLPLRF